jgi:hypothetical protein
MRGKHCPVCGSLNLFCGHREPPVAPSMKEDYERRVIELEARVAALEAPIFGHQPVTRHFAKPAFEE